METHELIHMIAPCIHNCEYRRGTTCPYKRLEDCPKYLKFAEINEQVRKERLEAVEYNDYVENRKRRLTKRARIKK